MIHDLIVDWFFVRHIFTKSERLTDYYPKFRGTWEIYTSPLNAVGTYLLLVENEQIENIVIHCIVCVVHINENNKHYMHTNC